MTRRRRARVLLWLRRYPDARAMADSALSLSGASPDLLDMKVATFLGQVVHVNFGLALALAGRRVDAMREGELAMKLEPIATNGITGPIVQHYAVLTYLALGERDAAPARLEPLLQAPYFLSPAWLRIDPTLAPLRNDPRFRKLMEG